MAELPPLRQEILVNATQAIAAMEKVQAQLRETGVVAQQTAAQTKMATMGIGSTFKALAGALFVTAGISAVAGAIRGMRDEAIQTEVAQQKLNIALSNIGQASAANVANLNDYANGYQKLGFEGSDATNAFARLVTATGSVDQAQRLMAISADYARNRNVSLASAAQLMSRATTGQMRAFTQYGITLDKTLPKNQAIAKAFDELNAKIGGSAIKYTKTFAGAMEVLKQRFEDFLENAIAPVLPYITKFLGVLVGAAEWIQQNSAALKVYIGLMASLVAIFRGYAIVLAIVNSINPFTYMVLGAIALGVVFVKLWNTFKIFRETMAETLATFLQFIGYIVGGIAKMIRLLSYLPGGGALKGVAEQADKIAVSVGKMAKSVDELKNAKIKIPKVPKASDFTNLGKETGITGRASGGDATKGGGGTGSGTVQYVTVYASNTNDIAKKMSKLAKNGQPIGGAR